MEPVLASDLRLSPSSIFDRVQALWCQGDRPLPAPERSCRAPSTRGRRVLSTYLCSCLGLGFRWRCLLWALPRSQPSRRHGAGGVDDAAMAAGLGATIPLLFTSSSAPAGVRSPRSAESRPVRLRGLYPGWDTEIRIPSFIVIVIGGMGTCRGAVPSGPADSAISLPSSKGLFAEPRACPVLILSCGGRAAGAPQGPVRLKSTGCPAPGLDHREHAGARHGTLAVGPACPCGYGSISLPGDGLKCPQRALISRFTSSRSLP